MRSFNAVLPISITKRIFIQINFLILTLLIVSVIYNGYNNYLIYKEETQKELYCVTDLLDNSLNSSFSEILFKNGASNKPIAVQVSVLNNQLQPIVNEMAKTYKNTGMGFYSIQLDYILAIHPYEPEKLVRIPHNTYPYFKIYDSGHEMYGQNDTSFGWNSKPILFYARPIKENGVIVGHVWANAKMEEIYERVYAPTLTQIFCWLIALALCYLYARKITLNTKYALETFSETAVTTGLENKNQFPELNFLSNSYSIKNKELISLNERLDKTLESISDGFYSLDNDWKFTYINKEAKKLLAQDGRELLGKVIWDELKSPATEIIYEKYHQAIIIQKPVNYEIFSSIANRWLDVTAYPSVDGLTVYFKDITKQKKHKQELINSEQRFSMAFNSSPSCMSIIRLDNGQFVEINKNWKRVLGYSREEVIGKTALELGLWVDINDRILLMDKLLTIGVYEDYECKMRKKTGDTFDCIISFQRTEINGENYLIGVFNDISEIKKGQELFYKAFHLSPDIMTIENISTGKYINVNESFIKCFGFSKDEILGKSAMELGIINEETRRIIVLHFKEHGFIKNIEIDTYDKQGKRHRMLFSCENVGINGQNCQLNCAKDISEKEYMEKEMQRLDRLNMLGEMASGIAHEIRNPLSIVRGFLQLMNERQYDSSGNIDLMIEELDRANSIISEYLSLAKNKPIEFQTLNLNDIILKLCPLIQADAIKSDKEILLDLQDVPIILLDDKEIRQLILNLVCNGLESMIPGGTLYLRTYCVGREVVLEVKDGGCGISREIIEKLGQPFVTTKDNGTGLGLSVCYRICERHNAELDFSTSPEGTTFYVRFLYQDN